MPEPENLPEWRLSIASQVLCALIQRNQGIEENWPTYAIKTADKLLMAHLLTLRRFSQDIPT